MNLNELSLDGVLAWIQLAYGPCKGSQCYIQNDQLFTTCIQHFTYDCIKDLLDNEIKIAHQYLQSWATYNNYFKLVALFNSYII